MSLKVATFDRLCMVSYWCSLVTLSLKRTVFEIFDLLYSDLESQVRGSLKVIENYTSRTHDFLLTFRSNHWPISHRFRDKRQYSSKIANFSYPRVLNAPDEGVPLGIWYRCKGSRMLL